MGAALPAAVQSAAAASRRLPATRARQTHAARAAGQPAQGALRRLATHRVDAGAAQQRSALSAAITAVTS